MESKLLIRFTNQSPSFSLGVEYGRLLQKFEGGLDIINNNGFPVRIDNIEVLKSTCKAFGYIPFFGVKYYNEWIDFLAIKKTFSDN